MTTGGRICGRRGTRCWQRLVASRVGGSADLNRIGDGAAIQSEPRYSGKQSKRRLAITNVRSATPYVVKRYR